MGIINSCSTRNKESTSSGYEDVFNKRELTILQYVYGNLSHQSNEFFIILKKK